MPSLCKRVIRFPRFKMVTAVWLILASLLYDIALPDPAMVMAFQTSLSELPISFPVQSPEVAAYFNQIARPQDIATFSPSNLQLLSPGTPGHKMVAYRSWADAERELDGLVDQIDMVMYNPEHWELTPADEQQDLAAVVKQFAEFAHARGLQFMFAPDRRYAEAYLSEVAPHVDMVLLQGQRLQGDPQAFSTWVLKMTEVARIANPKIRVYVQVGATLGTAADMLAAIQTVSSDIDGIAIWSMPKSLNILQEFVALLRVNPSSVELTPTSSATPAPPTPVPVESQPAIPTPGPTHTTLPNQGGVATPTPSAAVEEMLPIPTPAPATWTPTPTSTLTPAQSSAALATVEEIAAEALPATARPPLVSLSPELEESAQATKWRERIMGATVGTVIGLVAGMVIGVLLGFGIGSRRSFHDR